MNKKELVISQTEDILLNLARLYKHNDITNSDLQGIATVKAQELYDLIKQPEPNHHKL